METIITFFIAFIPAFMMASALELPHTTGEASGTLTVNEQTVDIRYSYARAVSSDEGLSHYIILSDAPLTAELLNAEGDMWSLSREGKLHYILIELNADGTRRIDIRHPAFQPLGYVNVGGKPYLFDITVQTTEKIEVHAYMNEPRSSFGDSWIYDVKFTAPVKLSETW